MRNTNAFKLPCSGCPFLRRPITPINPPIIRKLIRCWNTKRRTCGLCCSVRLSSINRHFELLGRVNDPFATAFTLRDALRNQFRAVPPVQFVVD